MKTSILCAAAMLALAAGAANAPAHEISAAGRAAFLRGEEDGRYRLSFRNRSNRAIEDFKVVVEQLDAEGAVLRSETFPCVSVEPGETRVFAPRIETRLSPGWRRLRVRFVGRNGAGQEFDAPHELEYGIGPRLAETMPVIHDGYGHEQTNATQETILRDLVDFGYNVGAYHFERFRHSEEKDRLPEFGTAFYRKEVRRHDLALVAGAGLVHSVRMQWATNFLGMTEEKFSRHGKDGSNLLRARKFRSAEMGHPAEVAYLRELTRRHGEMYATHPASVGVITMSEMRDFSQVSWGGWDEHYYSYLAGRRGYPDEIDGKGFDPKLSAVRWPNGIVPDNDPILGFFRWFWDVGDGWKAAACACADGYRDALGDRKPEFMVVWEPAVRQPPIWGAGGNSTMVNQWCYAQPEPLNIAGPCEEVLAMAKGHPGQKAMIANQLIMYRIYICPDATKPEKLPEWAVRLPKARFPGVPPDVHDESTWAMIAKPVDAIKYHGWGCIKDTGNPDFYVYTNPETGVAHRRMLREVVAPLGPMLLRLKREEPDVAVLESFSSYVLGRTGTSGGGWTAPSVLYVQRARLDPKVVYEDEVMKDGGLDGVKVLYMPRCKYLPRSVAGKVRDFQAAGGIIVADEDIVPCIKPDVKAPKVTFEPPPELDDEESMAVAVDKRDSKVPASEKAKRATRHAKNLMVRQAEELRKSLAGRYSARSDSSSPEIVVFNRQWKDVPYLFAINDRRDFGDYVGQWGQLMEKGLPMDGWVSVRDPGRKVGAVYELSRGGEVPFRRDGDGVKVDVSFSTSDGRLFAFLPERIKSLDAKASPSVARGGEIRVAMSVLGESGRAVPAILPVEIRVYDAAGRELDGIGYMAAADGVVETSVLTNLDDAKGDYKVVCRDRASGLSKTLTVRGE